MAEMMGKKQDAEKSGDMWKRWKGKGEFGVIIAFFLSLLMVHVLVGIGSMDFNYVLPYLLLVFFWYGFCEHLWIHTIALEWYHSSRNLAKIAAGGCSCSQEMGCLLKTFWS